MISCTLKWITHSRRSSGAKSTVSTLECKFFSIFLLAASCQYILCLYLHCQMIFSCVLIFWLFFSATRPRVNNRTKQTFDSSPYMRIGILNALSFYTYILVYAIMRFFLSVEIQTSRSQSWAMILGKSNVITSRFNVSLVWGSKQLKLFPFSY